MYATDTARAEAETRNVRRWGIILALLALPAFGILALIMGREAGWDFQNYHWYDPFALLNGRLGFDIGVGHHATYYNPLVDVPFFWLGAHFPSWVAGFFIGAQAGLSAALLGAIAYRFVPLDDQRHRLILATLLALLGTMGGGALGEVGKTSDDIACGLPVLAGVLILAGGYPRLIRAASGDLWGVVLPAGLLMGAAPGLKLTALPYAVGMGIAMIFLPGPWGKRLSRTFMFGLGVGLGFVLFGGYWLWEMYRFSGNPLFPYFNDVAALQSPLVPPGSYRDPTFLPKTLKALLVFPFAFSADSKLTAEWNFRDVHIAILYVLVPLAGLMAAFGFRPHGRVVEPVAARLMLVFAAATYAVWVALFAIYRYIVPLEMMAPIITVMAVAILPLSMRFRAMLAALLLIGAQIYAWKGDEIRLPWGSKYVEMNVPKLAEPQNAMVLMAGWVPLSYIIPQFPPGIPFLRIQGLLIASSDRTSGFGATMHTRVDAHKGPLYAVFALGDRKSAGEGLADFGLALDDSPCTRIESNVAEPLDFCPLKRATPQETEKQ